LIESKVYFSNEPDPRGLKLKNKDNIKLVLEDPNENIPDDFHQGSFDPQKYGTNLNYKSVDSMHKSLRSPTASHEKKKDESPTSLRPATCSISSHDRYFLEQQQMNLPVTVSEEEVISTPNSLS